MASAIRSNLIRRYGVSAQPVVWDAELEKRTPVSEIVHWRALTWGEVKRLLWLLDNDWQEWTYQWGRDYPEEKRLKMREVLPGGKSLHFPTTQKFVFKRKFRVEAGSSLEAILRAYDVPMTPDVATPNIFVVEWPLSETPT